MCFSVTKSAHRTCLHLYVLERGPQPAHLFSVPVMGVHHPVLGCILLRWTIMNEVSSIFTVGVHQYTFDKKNLFLFHWLKH